MSKGRPLKFNSPEELENKIEEYYRYCKDSDRKITVTGLAWYLDVNKQTLTNYEKAEENGWLKRLDEDTRSKYIEIIKKAKIYIESCYEEMLFHKESVIGAIFTLKNNYGWVDKQEVINTNNNIEIKLED